MVGSTLGSIYVNGTQIPFSSFLSGDSTTGATISGQKLIIVIDDGSATKPPNKNVISIISKRNSADTYYRFGSWVSNENNLKYWVGNCSSINTVIFRMTDYEATTNENSLYFRLSNTTSEATNFRTQVPQYYDFSPLFA